MRQSDLHSVPTCFLPHLSPLLSVSPSESFMEMLTFSLTHSGLSQTNVCIRHVFQHKLQTNSRSLESESQGYELRFSLLHVLQKIHLVIWFGNLCIGSPHVWIAFFLLLANFSSFFKILKFCLPLGTSTTPNIKAMLTRFPSRSTLSSFLCDSICCIFLFGVAFLHEKMPSVSIASNVQEDWHTESGMNCAGSLVTSDLEPSERSSGNRMRQLLPLGNFYILQKSSPHPFSFWAPYWPCGYSVWHTVPCHHTYKVSWPICKALCFSRAELHLLHLCIHSTPTVWFSWTFVWLVPL